MMAYFAVRLLHIGRVARIDTVHPGVFEGNEHSVAVGAATHCVGNPLVFFGGEV
jgi:hypothetical protein